MSAPTLTLARAVRAHERHACAFCVALQCLAVRRRDPVLLEAAIQLREVHAANDQERARFTAQVRGPRMLSLTRSDRRR